MPPTTVTDQGFANQGGGQATVSADRRAYGESGDLAKSILSIFIFHTTQGPKVKDLNDILIPMTKPMEG